MRLKPRPLEIEKDTGFGEHDLFKRKDFADRLTNLVKNIEDPTVFLLDAPWGDGKTTFLKQWAGELRNAGIPVIEFNAFARDYQADPFIALSAEIFTQAQKVASLKEKTRANFIESAKSLGEASLSIIAQIAIRKITSGELSLEDVKKLGEAPMDDVSAIIEERLKSVEADAELLSSFRDALEELAKGMCTEEGMPLVLIVDELDRCRPSFAVELIEKIKHVFSVLGVHFVLSAHLPQLAKIFQNTHGLGDKEQALIYFEKFYDVRLRLPISPSSVDTIAKRYIRHLWDELDLTMRRPERDIRDTLEDVFQSHHVSLRTIEKILANVTLYYAGLSSRGAYNIPFVSGICIIRHCAPELYEKIASSKIAWDDINEFFDFDNWSQKDGFSLFGDYWRIIFDRLENEPTKESKLWNFFQHNRGKAMEILPQIAAQVDNFYPSGP
ncbi:MAG: P-loop NTPase fold protein [Nitrospinae bacterium]|nr:P-loop NTPase fold protein [Nitrospinota bacterium]